MAVKVGDVVAWDKVPSGALVMTAKRRCFAMRGRAGEYGHWVGDDDGWAAFWPAWPWGDEMPNPGYLGDNVTIVALDVPADATAEHLRTLAEVFEVRENLLTLARWPDAPLSDDIYETIGQMAARREDWQTWLAKLLHRAGWRPGMTAEDAARMLAEVRDGEG